MLGDVELRRDDLAYDACGIDHEGHAARRQPAAGPGYAIGLGDLELGVTHQRKGQIQRVGERGVAPLRITADTDDLGAERGELRVLSPEVTRLQRSAGREVLRVEVEDQRSPLQEFGERDATPVLDRPLERRRFVSFANHGHLAERVRDSCGDTSRSESRL